VSEAVVIAVSVREPLFEQRLEKVAELAGLNASEIEFEFISSSGSSSDSRRLAEVEGALDTSNCTGDPVILMYTYSAVNDYAATARFVTALQEGAHQLSTDNTTVCVEMTPTAVVMAAPPPPGPQSFFAWFWSWWPLTPLVTAIIAAVGAPLSLALLTLVSIQYWRITRAARKPPSNDISASFLTDQREDALLGPERDGPLERGRVRRALGRDWTYTSVRALFEDE
jgi:hypothetical protein